MLLISTAARRDCHDRCAETPVFGKERTLVNLNCFDDIHGNSGAERAGRRVSNIDRVHKKCAAVLRTSSNLELSFRSSQYSRYQRQCTSDVGQAFGQATNLITSSA